MREVFKVEIKKDGKLVDEKEDCDQISIYHLSQCDVSQCHISSTLQCLATKYTKLQYTDGTVHSTVQYTVHRFPPPPPLL